MDHADSSGPITPWECRHSGRTFGATSGTPTSRSPVASRALSHNLLHLPAPVGMPLTVSRNCVIAAVSSSVALSTWIRLMSQTPFPRHQAALVLLGRLANRVQRGERL